MPRAVIDCTTRSTVSKYPGMAWLEHCVFQYASPSGTRITLAPQALAWPISSSAIGGWIPGSSKSMRLIPRRTTGRPSVPKIRLPAVCMPAAEGPFFGGDGDVEGGVRPLLAGGGPVVPGTSPGAAVVGEPTPELPAGDELLNGDEASPPARPAPVPVLGRGALAAGVSSPGSLGGGGGSVGPGGSVEGGGSGVATAGAL